MKGDGRAEGTVAGERRDAGMAMTQRTTTAPRVRLRKVR